MPRFKTSDVADADTQQCTFADLSLSPALLRSLQDMGCEHPSPVQMRTIPAALDGSDVIVQAKSGTGKTIAFCSVILEAIDISRHVTQALVLAPTREISMQVADELQRLSWYMDPPVDVACFIGGVSEEEDQARINQNGSPHVAACTPGRTVKLLRDKTLQTDMRLLVLDEADKLLKDNFRDVIKEITERVYTDSLQFLAVSATFPPPQVTEAENLFVYVEKKRAKMGEPPLRDLPKFVFLCTSAIKKDLDGRALAGDAADAAGGAVESAVLKGVLHFRHVVPGFHIRQKLPALLEILTSAAYQQAFVFCNDSQSAVHIAELLVQSGIPAAASSGRLEQSQRAQAFAGLKRCQYRVLVCTDLFARGVDSEHVDVVVNLDLPTEKETYLHRSGRTARFGSIGWSVSIVFEGDEAAHLDYFQMQLGFQLEEYSRREEVIAAHLAELGADAGSMSQPQQLQAASAASPPPHQAVASAPPARRENTQSWPPPRQSKAATFDAVALDEADGYHDDEEWQEPEDWEYCEEEEEEEEDEEEEELEEVSAAQMPVAAAAAAAGTTGTWTPERGSHNFAGQQHLTPNWLQLQEQLHEQQLLHQRQQQQQVQQQQQQQQQQLLQQQQQQLLPGLSATACASPPGLAQHSQVQSLLAQQLTPGLAASSCVPGNGSAADLFRRYPPPPILFNQSATLPSEQRALLPEWEAWMLRCGTFAEYAGRCPGHVGLGNLQPPTMGSHLFLQHPDVPARLQAMWAAHCRVWTAVH